MVPSTVLLVSLAGLDVFAIEGAPADTRAVSTGVARALGRKTLDASATFASLRTTGLLGFNDFEAFLAEPPSAWPASLKSRWTAELSVCRRIAGPTPWTTTLPNGRCCGLRVAKVLWRHWLKASKAARVFEFRVHRNDQGCFVSATRRDIDTATMQSRSVACGDLEQSAFALATELSTAGATTTPWDLPDALGVPVDVASLRVSAPQASLVTCDKAPSALSFARSTPLAEAIQGQWAAAGGKAKAAACSLEVLKHREPKETAITVDLDVLTIFLKCAGTEVVTEIGKLNLPRDADLLGKATTTLTTELAKRWCTPAPTP